MTNQGPTPPEPPARGYGDYSPSPTGDAGLGAGSPWNPTPPAQDPFYSDPHGQNPHGQNPHGQNQYGQNQYGQDLTAQGMNASNPNAWGSTPDQAPVAPTYGAARPQYGGAPTYDGSPPAPEWSAVPPAPGGQPPSAPLPPGFPIFGAPVGAPPPSPTPDRTPLIIGGVVVAVVIIVAVVAGVVLLGGGKKGGGGDGGSAEAAAAAYLNAIAKSDAKTALKYIEPPASELLLTNDVLKKQREKAPISNVKVLTSSGYQDAATAKVSYRLGDRDVQDQILLKKVSGTWQVNNGAIDIDLGNVDVPSLTAFGVDVSKQSTISVFPGPIEWGSANPNYAVDASKFEYPTKPSDYTSAYALDAKLSDQGGAAVLTAMQTYISNCATSKQTDASTDKPGCGQQVFAFDAVDGTVTWTAPQVTLDALKPRLDSTEVGKISIFTTLTWSASFRKRDNTTGTSQDPDLLVGKIDLSANPPVFTPD